jgi:predicted MFS family arabinose efflux permease
VNTLTPALWVAGVAAKQSNSKDATAAWRMVVMGARIYSDKKRPATFPIVLAGFTAFLVIYATQPLLPLFTEVFDASPFAVSLTVTAATVAVALAAPGAGRLADRIGRKRVIVGAAVGLTVATALAAGASSLSDLIFWRLVQGIFTPGVFAVTVAYIHDEFPPASTARATAAYVSGTVVGGFAGRAVSGAVADAFGWRAAFVALAVMGLALAVSLAAWLPRDRRPAGPSPRPTISAMARHLRNRQLQATFAIGSCVLFTLVAMFTYATFLLAAPPFDLSTSALGSLFTVYLVGAAITPVAGRWIDVFGHRRALAVSIGVGAAGAVVTLVPSTTAVVTGLGMCASGVFVSNATASGYVGTAAADDRGLAFGLYASFYYLGGSLGAALPALAWSAGGWPACVALVVGVQALTVCLAYTSWQERQGARVALVQPGG